MCADESAPINWTFTTNKQQNRGSLFRYIVTSVMIGMNGADIILVILCQDNKKLSKY